MKEPLHSPKDFLKNYSSFRFSDTSHGCVRFRNKVKDISSIALKTLGKEIFLGMFRFEKGYLDHCEATGSVKNCPEMKCFCDYLWFDIDNVNLEEALSNAREIISRLEGNFGVNPIHLSVYFSGNKGYHIGIPSNLFGLVPDVNVPQVNKLMAKKIADETPIDMSIYERNRLWRVPNSINAKSGLYKMPLSYNELTTLDSEAHKKLATTPREYNQPPFEEDEKTNSLLVKLYNDAKQSLSPKPPIKNNNLHLKGISKPCIETLFGGVTTGKRNEACMRLADHLRKQGVNEKDAVVNLREWNLKNTPQLDETEIVSTIKSVYTGDYDYGCNDEMLKSLCVSECQLVKNNLQKIVRTSFAKLSDCTLVEMLYEKEREPSTFFACYREERVTYRNSIIDAKTNTLYKPYPSEKIVASKVLELPSKAKEYGSFEKLFNEVYEFIGQYLHVSQFFQMICAYYILLSWLYDNFSVIPYLRVRGDYGTGKSRFLQTVGTLCYKPISCVGATSVSAIFRLTDMYHGTMIVDEADFSNSDESNKITKVFNSGFQKGFPVLLSAQPKKGQFEPTSYDVFGPKVIATRKEFKDKALESRCITEIMEPIPNLKTPLILPQEFEKQATKLREKLLMYRLHNYGKLKSKNEQNYAEIEPRLAQIMIPLLSIIDSESEKERVISFMKSQNKLIIEERGDSIEGKIASALCKLWEKGSNVILVKNVADAVNEQISNDRFKISSHKAGAILRKDFNLIVKRRNEGNYIVNSKANEKKIEQIAMRYGISFETKGNTLNTQSTHGASLNVM